MYKKYSVKKKGGKMLTIKKKISLSTAKDSDVIKAIVKSNKKHSKMMRKLAK